jgi:NAD(P)-dependent dehydrogenase (short-subunit alcohol dehydrogenase family)
MTNLLDLTGKKVLLTGACGAIGREVVRALIEHGASVMANDVLPENEATRLLGESGAPEPRVKYLQADITQAEAVEAMFEKVSEAVGLPDVVCCHAGVTDSHPVEEYPLEGFDSLFDVNLRGAFVVAQTAVRRWIEHGVAGHLIFTTSWVEDVPWPGITPYAASKAGMKAMMRGFARELAPKGIRANAIAPGIVAAGMAKRQWDTEPDYRARAKRAIPLGYMQPPETVAHAFLFLCSRMAEYMTGAVLLVDGGCSLYPMD